VTAAFVSSTFTDLKDFRAGVRAVIRRLGVVDVAMEHFGSRDERPLDECQRVINEECDIFVGIYAKKYGFVPEGTKASITALEYQTALQARLPVLAYLLKDKAPWPASKIERGDRARRLSQFKADLQKRHIVSFFSGRDQLAAMVAADLGRHLTLNKRRLTVVTQLSSESSERELRLLNEMQSGRPKERERAASALKQLGSRASHATLAQLMLGPDADLADVAAKALESSDAIQHGLLSPHADVRYWAAFRIGENALQNHQWGLELAPRLIELLESRTDSIDVLQQVTHSLGKIGGREAMKTLLGLLADPGVAPEIVATALHAPFRFWLDYMFASCASADLVPEFREETTKIVRGWPRARREQVTHHDLFEHLPPSVRSEIAVNSLTRTPSVQDRQQPAKTGSATGTQGIDPLPTARKHSAAARLVAKSLMPRLSVIAAANPSLSLRIEIVVLHDDDSSDDLCQLTMQNGLVEEREPRRGLDMILKATLEDWPGLVDGGILDASPLGDGPLRFSGDIGKFAQLTTAWKAAL
jgi:HEAT repeat protein